MLCCLKWSNWKIALYCQRLKSLICTSFSEWQFGGKMLHYDLAYDSPLGKRKNMRYIVWWSTMYVKRIKLSVFSVFHFSLCLCLCLCVCVCMLIHVFEHMTLYVQIDFRYVVMTTKYISKWYMQCDGIYALESFQHNIYAVWCTYVYTHTYLYTHTHLRPPHPTHRYTQM
jgi:hypothetical protein